MRPITRALLAITAAPAIALASPGGKAKEQVQLSFELASGSYLCEFGHRVEVQRDLKQNNQLNIAWRGQRYQLERDLSSSGLPRYEDRRSGLVWIDLPWKAVLLDGRTQTPLANDCKTV